MTKKEFYFKDLTDFDEARKESIEEFIKNAKSTYEADIKAANEEIDAEEKAYKKRWKKDLNVKQYV